MEHQSAALRAMNDAVLAIAAEATIEPMLQRLVHSARELVDAKYAAIGVPDNENAFAQFITSDMSDELIAAISSSLMPDVMNVSNAPSPSGMPSAA